MIAVEVRDVSLMSGTATLLDRINLEIPESQVTTILGPNGAGKTTLLRVIAGLETATNGEITIDGRSTHAMSFAQLAEKRSYMSTNLPSDVPFTVRDVVRMGQHPWVKPNESLVDRAIASMDLGTLAHRLVSSLSTGEARRTQMARILAQVAPLMILDEPTNGLDIAHTELVLGTLRDSAANGSTVVAVLHDLSAAVRFADHVVVMKGGTVRSAGHPDDVLSEELLSDIFELNLRMVGDRQGRALMILPADSPGDRTRLAKGRQ